ncbi:unnamed protein product, partial [Adineta steineri]
MESLPDELLLIIFEYLSQYDLFYAFHNLNYRFERIIACYFNSIDLNQCENLYYKRFRLFCEDLIPSYGHQINSLSIYDHPRIRVLQPYLHYL